MINTARELCTAFWDVAVGWYRVDRIRISPTAGRLLSLRVGDRVVLKGELFKVTQRRLGEAEEAVEYVLKHPDGDAVLRIPSVGEHMEGYAEFLFLDHCEAVADDELVVL
ncbi:hypothetical protein RMSM_06846 [Rhodopirellula maiorica SM1]|uniref:Uncharacterized protein n=1 Tax=Rhodopirellula maiorica SM1 TaxID=1265738 RepID=M5RQL0_9BACT|nr:hypothetical protein [Rhodopirellula maiorica]EMI16239.1 hypothetical protein RMSM_06846 [Rhodopirellula maiorica SM1]